MAYILVKTVHWFFLVYTGILFVRLIGSWFPKYSNHPVMRFARFYADPYLNVFRRLIPPIGGALDLSPMLGFFALQIIERIVLGFLGGFF